jgi:sugar lactone lactonase YvrE
VSVAAGATRFLSQRFRRTTAQTSRVASLVGLLLAAQACKSSTAPNSKNSGTLVITVKPTNGATPLVVVTGPSGDTAVVTRTDTTLFVPAGTYTVASASAVVAGAITTTFYAGTAKGSPANLATGGLATISITFALRPGSGHLWVVGGPIGHSVAAGYAGADLGSGVATVSLAVAGQYGAFDAHGNLWVADSSANTITEYSADQLATSGTPTPTVAITSGALQGPVGLAFDHTGTLWVSNFDGNTVVGFFTNQLRAGGIQKPAVVISGIAFDGPARIQFDTGGNLWVPNTLTSTVVAIASSSLAVTGTPLPAVTLTSSSGSLNGPSGLAFDGSGDLWVANSVGSSLVAFTPSALVNSGPAVPFEILIPPASTGSPTTIAFDNSGDLWTNSTTGGAVLGYTGVQLAVGDTVPPAVVVPVASPPSTLAFNPASSSLPIAGGAFARIRRTP